PIDRRGALSHPPFSRRFRTGEATRRCGAIEDQIMATSPARTMSFPPIRTARQLSARQLSRNNQRRLKDKSCAGQGLSTASVASSNYGGPHGCNRPDEK
ncbi:MAG: hypothetical protein WBL84_06865, partial [Xanthobacteraceae bacterium]